MKLEQRIVLGYYQAKLKVIELISTEKAAEAAFTLFCTPYSKRKTYTIPESFEKAEKLSFQFKGHEIHGFRWKSGVPTGLKVLICHGFDSFSYRFERYIKPLLKEGFEVFAFDAPAHGLSSGKTINALLYKDMIIEINNRYGSMDGIMAHSFGGLAAVLVIEELKGKIPKRLVLIAPATETTRSVGDFCRHLKISKSVKAELEKILCKIGGNPAAWFSVSRVIQQISTPTLWLQDMKDTITPYDDMKHLKNLKLPHVEFVITDGLGHSLYRTDSIANKAVEFLAGIKTA
jgi:alpha-beta hydrolase superfamily lysophospholipase